MINKNFYKIYQYVVFLVAFPIVAILWYKIWDDIKFTVLTLSLPIITAYVVPAVGTNITNLWEFNNTKFMIGKFRVYHGFVLGSATSLFGLMFYNISPNYTGILNTIFFALICGGFIAFWNYIYDVYAVECGFIKLKNKPAYEKKSSYEIVADYAPVYFYAFGFIYYFYIKVLEYFYVASKTNFIPIVIFMHIAAIIFPTVFFAGYSYKKHHYFGIFAYNPKETK